MTADELHDFRTLAAELHPRLRPFLRLAAEAVTASADAIEARRADLRTVERLRDAARLLDEARWAVDDHARALEP